MFGNFRAICLCVAFLYVYCVSGQGQQEMLNKLACIEHEDCGSCLAAATHCRWCADPYYNNATPRCNDYDSLVGAECSQNTIMKPEQSVWEVMDSRPLQDMQPRSMDTEAVVQIQPQRLRLSLKPRESKKIEFAYRPAKNYPLDLYYLMDLTWSMKDDKDTLVKVGDDLAAMLKNLTDNFRLGFGSFADKPLMPFISVDAHRLQNPCGMQEESCEATYTYKHQLSLTDQVTDFIEKVNSSRVTANMDNAEGQLDALVQVLACGDKIGWSPTSRKIVMLLSDGLVHTAGDGLLGGATRKNDETCHLDERGYYADSVIYDYPSIAQVYRLLEHYKVNVIFAVTESVKSYYDSLHELLDEFTYIAKLETDSSNILKVVKTGYEDIVSVVDFEDDSSSGPVKVKYFTDCGVEGGVMMEVTRCSGVEFGMTLNYEAHISLDSCPKFQKSTQTIKITESQLGHDSLTLEVDIHCGCSCEDQQNDALVTCGANKELVCGVCTCKEGWSGPDCDCQIESEEASSALLAQCWQPNVTHAMCSGAGDCLCGQCHCDRGYRGKYCQCQSCQISHINGAECGGIDRGVCICGECACVEGWSGATCDCTNQTDSCVAPGAEASDVCSGRGDCVCGRCECSSSLDGDRYSGAYCETCASCVNPLCTTTEPCVACHFNDTCTDLCVIGGGNYTVTERLNDPVADNSDEVSCIYRQDDNGLECDYQYTYAAGTQDQVAMEVVIRSKECFQPTSARIMTSALVIMACVVAAGIVVILAVKSAQIVSDRRAYAKFLAEAQESRKNMQELNPLYISPISEFKLPESYPRE